MTELKIYDAPKERGTVKFSVVLRDLGERPNGCRYVTHMRDDDLNAAKPSSGYFWGHYFDDLETAERDFIKRSVQYPGGKTIEVPA
jgi:hypothetical protein